MARLRTMMCRSCTLAFLGNVSDNKMLVNPICPDCERLEEDTEKERFLLERKNGKKTLEQRIEWLEEYAYEHSKVKHGYTEPPRFLKRIMK